MLLSFSGCALDEERDIVKEDSNQNRENLSLEDTNLEDVLSQDNDEQRTASEIEEGETHLDIPNKITLDAEVDDFVLSPSRATIDRAILSEEGNAMKYYFSKLKEIGQAESTLILEDTETEFKIPNSLIIPIPKGQEAEVGDIVLSWIQGDTIMSRGVVVEGGSITEPNVKFYDTEFDLEPMILGADTFVKLEQDYQPGTVLAVQDGDILSREMVIRKIDENKVITSGFAHVLYLRDIENTSSLPIKPSLAVGDEVMVPVLGNFTDAKVIGMEPEIAKVRVEYQWVGRSVAKDFFYGDILPK